MTMEQIEKRREEVDSILSNLYSKATSGMKIICCIWESPLCDKLEHREGFFLDNTEASFFSELLNETYNRMNLVHEVYKLNKV